MKTAYENHTKTFHNSSVLLQLALNNLFQKGSLPYLTSYLKLTEKHLQITETQVCIWRNTTYNIKQVLFFDFIDILEVFLNSRKKPLWSSTFLFWLNPINNTRFTICSLVSYEITNIGVSKIESNFTIYILHFTVLKNFIASLSTAKLTSQCCLSAIMFLPKRRKSLIFKPLFPIVWWISRKYTYRFRIFIVYLIKCWSSNPILHFDRYFFINSSLQINGVTKINRFTMTRSNMFTIYSGSTISSSSKQSILVLIRFSTNCNA